jgi:hypothetical protein
MKTSQKDSEGETSGHTEAAVNIPVNVGWEIGGTAFEISYNNGSRQKCVFARGQLRIKIVQTFSFLLK